MAKIKRINFDLGRVVKPENARSTVALALDGQHPGLVSSMMNYKTVDGHSVAQNAYPAVQFGYWKNGFCIYGFGQQGIEMLDDAAPLIQSALAKKESRIVRVQSSTVEASAEKRPYALRYRVPAMVIQKKLHHLRRITDPKLGKPFLEQLFKNSILRQADFLGLSVDPQFDVQFVGAKKILPMYNPFPGSPKMRGLRDAYFETNLALSGFWSVGFALGNGYGQFNASMQRGLER